MLKFRNTMTMPTPPTLPKNPAIRAMYFVLGVVSLILGVIGAVLPVMPTTVFILLAAFCFAKSSRRFSDYLLTHPTFGRMIIDWQTRRAIPRRAKYLAWTMMTVSVLILLIGGTPLWVLSMVAVLLLAVAIWMARLPDA